MLWDKGVDEFVAAIKILRGKGVVARFVLVGDSDEENPAAIPVKQLESWRDSGVVEWWGRRDDMPEVLAQATIVCLPSRYREGLPKVLLEAAACGRALISTDAPGCREIVHHGVNGLLVPIRDANSLALAIERLLGEPVTRAEMGRQGRKMVVAEFSESSVAAQTLAVYEEMTRRIPHP
jgi:glycosyltransferase involved in cell wall biosynthesis